MIILALGSSISPRLNYLKSAVDCLNNHSEIKVIKQSKIYSTPPFGLVAKNEFLNMCVLIEYNNTPYKLLKIINNIEEKLLRKRLKHWDDRTIDIDIILFNDYDLDDEILTIPHKYASSRNFVLYPLLDINENIKINNIYVKDLINNLTDKNIKIYKERL